MHSLKIESIYTDGACSGNPGPGGWGIVVCFSDGSIHEMGGASPQTTNNRMELQAAIAALEFLQAWGQKEAIVIYTDSEYVINCVNKWLKPWKKKGWKKADNSPVLNRDLLEIIDQLNSPQVTWQHVRGHAGNEGNSRCDEIARAFASGKTPVLREISSTNFQKALSRIPREIEVASLSDSSDELMIMNQNTQNISSFAPDTNMNETSHSSTTLNNEELPREMRVVQLRNLVETLRIADEIAEKGYLITSSELADLMDVHASAVTSRGDQWRWRNWIVSRVRREGNQILWELERSDRIKDEDE